MFTKKIIKNIRNKKRSYAVFFSFISVNDIFAFFLKSQQHWIFDYCSRQCWIKLNKFEKRLSTRNEKFTSSYRLNNNLFGFEKYHASAAYREQRSCSILVIFSLFAQSNYQLGLKALKLLCETVHIILRRL